MSGTSRHYVEDYRAYVAAIQAEFAPLDAMAIAVGGGDFAAVGDASLDLLTHFGLTSGHRVVDVGCGSGRLAAALTRRHGDTISYLGLDVVEDLLEHAQTVADPSYRFQLNTELTIPVPDASCDFIVFFSVVTHLFHEESFRYLRDSARALKPGGKIVVSFYL